MRRIFIGLALAFMACAAQTAKAQATGTVTGTASVTIYNSLTITTPNLTLPTGTVGAAYSENVGTLAGVLLNGAACGTACTYTATGLPSWATMSSSGVFSGTPNAAGTTTFTYTVSSPNAAAVKGRVGAKKPVTRPVPTGSH